MAYRWARWLDDALRKEGVKVVLEPGWENRGRYRSDGRRDLPPNWDFEPNGLSVWHHTASTSSPANPYPTRRLLIEGRSDLPGPLCQGAPAHDGRVHLIAAGRANHAGEMSGRGPTSPGADGNITAIGWEIETNGTQKIPTAQFRAAIRCAAAVNRRFDRGSDWSLGHAETSVTGKWDPGVGGRTVDLDAWRRAVAEALSYPPGVWQSPSGTSSWGEVDVSELRAGAEGRSPESVKRMQYRLKRANPGKMPERLRNSVSVNGRWDDATTAALAHWQAEVFAPRPESDGYTAGRRLGPVQAEVLFGPRYRLVN